MNQTSAFLDLKAQMSWWLKLATNNDFLNSLRNAPENLGKELAEQFLTEKKELLIGFNSGDIEQAWNQSFTEQIIYCKKSLGWHEFKVGTCVVKSTFKSRNEPGIKSSQNLYDYQFGRIVDLEILPVNPTPIVIIWEEETEPQKYSLYEAKTQNISPITPLIKVSDSVAYETSLDGLFYRVYLGFSSQKVAKSWLWKLKRELGWIEQPRQLPPSEKPTIHKYHCFAENSRQKTRAKRLEKLQIVANWDLSRD